MADETVSPLTEAEMEQGLRALEAARALTREMRQRRGGEPWPDINRARDERSQQLLDA